jgi:hypothetical protein
MIKKVIQVLLMGFVALSFACAGSTKSASQPASQAASKPAADGHDGAHQHKDGEHAHEGKCAACEKGKTGGTAWCDGCKVGYVDGKVVKCKACFKGKSGEAVWCDKCNKGHVNKEAVKCKACFAHKTGGEPCAEHAKK